ncbi:MAG TPA: adenylate/guanylate cyclase domain-containing protein [Oligoflexus sp.]|uniref:adenylate/guanylate cyclase domain-containing protein n=1 Tax=Oligoflexus sp. TaxID=1971216 RepID=UPI002D709CD5|nr:adenylate/guanylate cyclase domain-containing protein [Oligoflexus sp.]HYX31986.1 adenylate/guanylate cyclase domain-containing protein [Oligoflexus sp.]
MSWNMGLWVQPKKSKFLAFKLSKRRIYNGLGPYAAGLCACSTVIMTNLVISFTGQSPSYDYVTYIIDHFLYSLPFSLLFLFDFPMSLTNDRQTKKLIVKHLTFICVILHGITGTCFMLRELPADVNCYPAYFWFTYGVMFFFLGAANFLNLLLYGAVYFAVVVTYMMRYSDFSLDENITLTAMLFQLLHFTPVALLARMRIAALRHAFKQLEKVFYPHQIKMIRRARELEQTMPTTSGEGCVICFDIIASSQIQHEKVKEFLRIIFARCNSLMMEGYNGIDMASRGYRIKEMGDGFLCSVGYPFKSRTGYVAKDALDLALQFHDVFQEEVRLLEYDRPIHCGIGIAYDGIAGFFPESGAKEYDLHGRAIALATRYEAMRKSLFAGKPPASLVILQDRVWSSLKADDRRDFIRVNLQTHGLTVRDDPDAKGLYYRLLGDVVTMDHAESHEAGDGAVAS